MSSILIEYDPDADALYVSLHAVEPGCMRGARELDERRFVRYDDQDRPAGVEFCMAARAST